MSPLHPNVKQPPGVLAGTPTILFSLIRRPPSPPLFPYTTLFRSAEPEVLPEDAERGADAIAPGPRLQAAADELDRRVERRDRKSTRLNSSHPSNSYAVFCLKKKM